MWALMGGDRKIPAGFPMVSEQDKANEEVYWQREQARYDFAEWQVGQVEAEIVAEWETMTPSEREAAECASEDGVIEPW